MYIGGIAGTLGCTIMPVGPSWRTEFLTLPLIDTTNTHCKQ